MSSSIPSWQILTAHAQPFRGARDLVFCLKVPLDSLLVWARGKGSGETARMRRLAWTFAARIGDKYQIRLTRPIYFLRLFQSGQLDLRHFDPEFVREPVPGIISDFLFPILKSVLQNEVLSYPLSAQRRLWSDWADAQADLSLRWAHIHFGKMSQLVFYNYGEQWASPYQQIMADSKIVMPLATRGWYESASKQIQLPSGADRIVSGTDKVGIGFKRTDKHYPSVIVKYPPYLFHWLLSFSCASALQPESLVQET